MPARRPGPSTPLRADRREPLILRRAPPGAALRGDGNPGLAAEADLIRRAAAGGVPVPDVVAVLQPPDGLGEGFVMARLHGETLGRRIAAAHRPALAWQVGAALARIHAVDMAGAPALRRTQPRAEVQHLADWHARHGTVRPVFQLALRWLADQAPADVAHLALVHGDFRNGNLMVDLEADGGSLVGVLDWELAHLGDPMADLGWLGVNSWRYGRHQRPVGGFGHWAQLFDGYRSAGGTVDDARVHWWQVLGSLRWGVICESMGHAWPQRCRAGDGEGGHRPPCVRSRDRPAGTAAAAFHTHPGLSMHDQPNPEQLLAAVARFLRDDAGPALARHGDHALAYQARVAANMVDTVARQTLQARPPTAPSCSVCKRCWGCRPTTPRLPTWPR